MKPLLYFAHANGFPATTYQQLFNALSPHYDIKYIDMVGHDPNYPVTDNWPHLVQQVIDDIEARCDGPVYAIGHSLGGALVYRSAICRPELFRGVILLDTPMFNLLTRMVIKKMKWLNVFENYTPAKRTLHRRAHWQNKQQALAHFKTKNPYKYFTAQCLHDFVEFGTRQAEDGVRLRFDPRIEYKIYNSMPAVKVSDGPARVPVALFVGKDQSVVRESDLKYMQQKLKIDVHTISGGHMFPFQYPELLAKELHRVLQNW